MFLPFVPLKVRFVPHPVDTGNSIGYYLPEKLREIRKKRRVNNEMRKFAAVLFAIVLLCAAVPNVAFAQDNFSFDTAKR